MDMVNYYKCNNFIQKIIFPSPSSSFIRILSKFMIINIYHLLSSITYVCALSSYFGFGSYFGVGTNGGVLSSIFAISLPEIITAPIK